eukprot:gb/GEZN01008523.1/.p1 GENE.gb/GEZN01008523.1/~~gb/GEZN01008523.1/.p1  ORF type:complete len:414 (-),score=18.18 gb/GEZN01008523.1/:123-1364(-)
MDIRGRVPVESELDLETAGSHGTDDNRKVIRFSSADRKLVFLMLVCGCVLGALAGRTYCFRRPAPTADLSEEEWLLEREAEVNLTETERRARRLGRLEIWFKEQGGTVHPNVQLRPYENAPSVWGFFATGPVVKNEVIVAAPQHLFVSSYTALAALTENLWALKQRSSLPSSKLTPKLLMETLGFSSSYDKIYPPKDIEDSEMPNAVLALWIYTFTGVPGYFFRVWLDTLPHTCQNPTCWPDSELRKVFNPTTSNSIIKSRKLYETVAIRLGINATEYLISVSVVNTRYWNDPTMKFVPTMVPFADMVNHPPADKSGVYATFASRSLAGCYLKHDGKTAQPGDEVYCSYGKKNNGQLLRNYGFTLSGNPEDKCQKLLTMLTPEFIATNITLPKGEKCEASPVALSQLGNGGVL